MTPGDTAQIMQTGLRQAQELESRLHPHTVPEIACVGACILARAAWTAHCHLARANQHKSYRHQAHAMLADVLDQCELLFTETEGRA